MGRPISEVQLVCDRNNRSVCTVLRFDEEQNAIKFKIAYTLHVGTDIYGGALDDTSANLVHCVPPRIHYRNMVAAL